MLCGCVIGFGLVWFWLNFGSSIFVVHFPDWLADAALMFDDLCCYHFNLFFLFSFFSLYLSVFHLLFGHSSPAPNFRINHSVSSKFVHSNGTFLSGLFMFSCISLCIYTDNLSIRHTITPRKFRRLRCMLRTYLRTCVSLYVCI